MRSAPRFLWLLTLLPALSFAQGMLIPTDPSMGPLGIKYQRVSAEIKDGTAVTRVEQVFVNDGPTQLEAHYIFPLPKGAALQEFYLWINGQKTKGEVIEKEKATQIYEGIVRRLRDPGLLEYVDSDAFRARVFPVPAHGEQRIELSFSQVLDYSSGLYHYHYPLGASSKGAPPLRVRQDFTFSAKLASKTPIRSVYSPTHKLGVSHQGENGATVGLEEGAGFDISKDLDLYYSVSDKAVGLSMMTWKKEDEPGYFLALISPKNEFTEQEIIGKRITFVIDTSGSMMGKRMEIAKNALKYCVKRINPQDKFNVVRFSTDVESLWDAPMDGSEKNIKKAVEFVDSMEAIGGTAIDEAMRRALKDGAGDSKNPHLVMFITDGQPTVGETDEEAIARNATSDNKYHSRVFTFGVGEDLNAKLLDRLAAEGSGTSDYVRDGKDFEEKISGFYDKVSHPVLADLALDLSSIGAYDVYPKKLNDLFKGSQLVVMGRYRTPGDAKVKLTGYVNGDKKTFEYGTTAPVDRRADEFVPRLWAIRKVGYLIEEIRIHGEKPELKDEIVMLGKKFGIVTPYTSYLVVEDTQPNVVANNWRPPPPPMSPPMDRTMPQSPPAPMEEKSESGGGFFSRMFAGGKGSGSMSAPPAGTASAPRQEAPRPKLQAKKADEMMRSAEGEDAIEISRATKDLKEADKVASSNEPVRTAGGRTYVWHAGSWTDTELVDNPGKVLKVKYLSEAYFKLLSLRPELKAALALGDHVTVKIASGKTVVIAPNDGEDSGDKLSAFVK